MFIFRFRKSKKTKKPKPESKEDRQNPVKRRTRRIEQFKNVCKKITTFLFSRVGLCFVVVGYVVVGGFIFKSIEGSHEEEKAKNRSLINDVVNFKTDTLVNEIWNMTKFEKVFHEKNYTSKLKAKLIDYQKNLTDAVKDGYKGTSNHNITKWTYPGSILYSVTIVTTIGLILAFFTVLFPGNMNYLVKGYGHITCETDAGKVATIFYAIIGIPMMLLCLANIGTSMANLFRFLYARVCCGYCNYVKRRHIRLKAATLSTAAVTHANALSYAALASTNMVISGTPGGAVPISADQGSTGNGEATNGQPLQSSPPFTVDTVVVSENFNPKNSKPNKNTINSAKILPELSKYDSLRIANTPLIKSPPNEKELLELFDENNSTDYKKITVPISLTLFVLSSYILLGGILFQTLEEWTVLEGVYFCFITLSTIGLGDYVPGNSINDSDTQAELKLVGCSLYLLMGLSLIAMCFNLMQEEVSAKFRRLAVRLGIIDDPNYW